MKQMKQQSGFTLIELVVVFVILGILAATAIPRFTSVAAQSRAAVADGIVGAVQSAAVISYATNAGQPSSATEIMDEVICDVQAADAVTVSINAGAAVALTCDGTVPAPGSVNPGSCNGAGPNEIIVSVGGVNDSGTTNTDSRSIPQGLCSG